MYVLGIETSCDETSASIVKNGTTVRSNVVSSSINFHKKYGGIVPEIASRRQLETITQVVDAGVKESGISLGDIGLVSVTNAPGLIGSLLVGISFAKSLSYGLGIPLLGIDHIQAHMYACFLNQASIPMPFVALIVSGGHTSLFYVEDFDAVRLLGQTQDDACGEAFDKVAKILGLGYPGGPVIEKLAAKGDPRKIKFQCSGTEKPLNFSFSGIKTAVLYYVRKHRSLSNVKGAHNYTPSAAEYALICDICASFQESVVDVLVNKALLAAKAKKVKALVVGGGVAANGRLRETFLEKSRMHHIKIYFPAKEFCMDNAAMVAGLGYRLYKKGHRSSLYLSAELQS
jgi:N6-L-threonylcarbamoyladenine synthase